MINVYFYNIFTIFVGKTPTIYPNTFLKQSSKVANPTQLIKYTLYELRSEPSAYALALVNSQQIKLLSYGSKIKCKKTVVIYLR